MTDSRATRLIRQRWFWNAGAGFRRGFQVLKEIELTGVPDSPHSIAMIEPEKWYAEGECDELFAILFPNGFAGENVLAEIAPEGWPQSALRFIFHPTVDQVYFEAVQMHKNLQSWIRKDTERSKEPEPTWEKVAAEYRDHPVDVEREVRELVGRCSWDVFSDEHSPGAIVFRKSGWSISLQINQTAQGRWESKR